MKAMDKIRNLARRNWSSLTNRQISEMTGVSAPTVAGFMSGRYGSWQLSEYCCDRYGEPFISLLKRARMDYADSHRDNLKKARASRKGRYTKRFPTPEKIVDMPQPYSETHNLIDPAVLPTPLQRFCGYLEIAA